MLQSSLKKHGFNAGALHGDMSQPARMETLDRIQAGRDPDPRRLRRRRPRPRHRRHEPRLQFRRAVLARGLRAPHRPHRPRRQDRPFLHPGLAVRRRSDRGDREADRHHDSRASRSRASRPARSRRRTAVAAVVVADAVGHPRSRALRAASRALPAANRANRQNARPTGRPEPRARTEPDSRGRAPRSAPRESRSSARRASAATGPAGRAFAEPPAARAKARPARAPRRDRRSEGRDEPAPVGLGDHVPAFLARPPR